MTIARRIIVSTFAYMDVRSVCTLDAVIRSSIDCSVGGAALAAAATTIVAMNVANLRMFAPGSEGVEVEHRMST
ncbi:MAG: hypothetical protein ABI330_11700 [Caldimonas sp.]